MTRPTDVTLTNAEGYTTEVTFNVPSGQAWLNASVSLVGVVNLSLISPKGQLAEYNLPQGVGNYGNAQVANPAAGTWTALIATAGTGAPVPAQFQASTATWQPFGSLTANTVTLAPGACTIVLFTASTPAQPGDQSGSIIVRSTAANVPAFTRVTSIPVTLRSLVPAPDPSTTVTGTLTGGNGREANTGQTAYYQVQIPSGLPALNASVNTGNASNTVFAELVDPSGAVASAASSGLLVTTSTGSPRDPARSRRPAARPEPGSRPVDADCGLLQLGVGDRGKPALHGHPQRHPGDQLRKRAS